MFPSDGGGVGGGEGDSIDVSCSTTDNNLEQLNTTPQLNAIRTKVSIFFSEIEPGGGSISIDESILYFILDWCLPFRTLLAVQRLPAERLIISQYCL